jgi:hypothetical protein
MFFTKMWSRGRYAEYTKDLRYIPFFTAASAHTKMPFYDAAKEEEERTLVKGLGVRHIAQRFGHLVIQKPPLFLWPLSRLHTGILLGVEYIFHRTRRTSDELASQHASLPPQRLYYASYITFRNV